MAVATQNPTPQAGSGWAGGVPGVISNPTSIYDQLNQNVPQYGALTTATTGNISNELNGQVSPTTQNLIQNKAAAAGVAGGVPGSGFQQNNALANLGMTAEQLQHQGVTDYSQFSNTVGNEQLSPEIQTEVATQNAIDAAAPNPAAAQSYAQMLFDKYLNANKPAPSKGFIPAGVDPAGVGPGEWNYLQYS
jgi:hypothetical protein